MKFSLILILLILLFFVHKKSKSSLTTNNPTNPTNPTNNPTNQADSIEIYNVEYYKNSIAYIKGINDSIKSNKEIIKEIDPTITKLNNAKVSLLAIPITQSITSATTHSTTRVTPKLKASTMIRLDKQLEAQKELKTTTGNRITTLQQKILDEKSILFNNAISNKDKNLTFTFSIQCLIYDASNSLINNIYFNYDAFTPTPALPPAPPVPSRGTTTTKSCSSTVNSGVCANTIIPVKTPASTCKAVMQDNGNFIIYKNDVAVWTSRNTKNGPGPYKLVMQGNGNLVVLDKNEKIIWNSNSSERSQGPYRLVMKDDCNLVVRDKSETIIWASGTNKAVTGGSRSQFLATTGSGGAKPSGTGPTHWTITKIGKDNSGKDISGKNLYLLKSNNVTYTVNITPSNNNKKLFNIKINPANTTDPTTGSYLKTDITKPANKGVISVGSLSTDNTNYSWSWIINLIKAVDNKKKT